MKLVVFDFDSTLMDGETIDELAKLAGRYDEVSAITHEAMSGRYDFFESLTKRAELLKGVDYARALEACKNLPLMNGAKKTVTELKKMGYKVVIFSGGFREATMPAGEVLGVDADFANYLHHKDGVITGKVSGEMAFDFSKGLMMKRLQNLLGITADQTIAVGDGANDRAMFAEASTKIAFCAKEVLRREATITIDEKDLTKILDFVEDRHLAKIIDKRLNDGEKPIRVDIDSLK